MKVRTGSAAVADALAPLGGPDGCNGAGLVFAPRRGITSWDEAEDELVDAFRLSKAAMLEDGPVIYLLHADAVLGRAPVLDSAVAAGLVGGARALAFEGVRRGRYAAVIGIDAAETESSLKFLTPAVEFAMATRAGAGQVTMLANQHLGAMLP